jgi:serine/threonine protein kinase
MLAALAPGRSLAGFRLEEQIGAGGMAVVFRARDERLGRTVALKILAPGLAGDDEFRERFIRESRAAAAVDHPHIIPVYAAGEVGGVLYIAMRFVSGGDLRSLIYREGPLSSERVASLLAPVASALDTAHAARLVHRDVKPANILVDASPGRPDHPYLSDFGLAKGSVSSMALTGTGQFLGTPDFCAPEQISGQRTQPQTDQYALACVAFTMLTGRLPFARTEPMAVLWAHMSGPPPSVASLRPDLPAAVDQVLARALAKSPDDRFGTCGEFADSLRGALRLGWHTSPARSGAWGSQGQQPPVPTAAGGSSAPQATWPGSITPAAPLTRAPSDAATDAGTEPRGEPASAGGEETASPTVRRHPPTAANGSVGATTRGKRTRRATSPTRRVWIAAAAVVVAAAGATAGTVEILHNPATAAPSGDILTTPGITAHLAAQFHAPVKGTGSVAGPAGVNDTTVTGFYLDVSTTGKVNPINYLTWDIATRAAIPMPSSPPDSVSDDGRFAGYPLPAGNGTPGTRIWDIAGQRWLSTVHNGQPYGLVTAGGALAANVPSRHEIQVWNATTGDLVSTLSYPAGSTLGSWNLSDDDSTTAAITTSGTIYVWNTTTSRVIDNLRYPGRNLKYAAVYLSANGQTLGSWSPGDSAYLWSTSGHTLIRTLPDGLLAISPDGKFAATDTGGNDPTVVNIQTGKVLLTLDAPGENGTGDLVFSPDAKTIAVGDGSGNIYVWRVSAP